MIGKSFKFEPRNCFIHVAVPGLQSFSPYKETGSRDPKGPTFNCTATERFRSDYPILNFSIYQILFSMRNREEICLEGKHSTLQPASTERNSELEKIISEYFNEKDLPSTIENLNQLLSGLTCLMCPGDKFGISHDYISDSVWNVTMLTTFLVKLYEQNLWIQSHPKSTQE